MVGLPGFGAGLRDLGAGLSVLGVRLRGFGVGLRDFGVGLRGFGVGLRGGRNAPPPVTEKGAKTSKPSLGELPDLRGGAAVSGLGSEE